MTRKLKLTEKRQKWADARQSVTLLGAPLRQNIKAEDRYARRLERLTDAMTREVSREIKKLFRTPESREYFAEDASVSSMSRKLINKLSDKYVHIFEQASKGFAQSMLKDMNKSSAQSMRESLSKLSGGLTIDTDYITDDMKEVMTASIAENVNLIRSIPREYLQDIGGAVMRSITHPEEGGWSGLMEHAEFFLDKRNKQIHNKARNLALDQTRKAYNNLNAGRMKAAGVSKFKWLHSFGGQRPRQHHLEMHGNIYSLDDLPIIEPRTGERGIPGQAINCRCTMLPLIEF